MKFSSTLFCNLTFCITLLFLAGSNLQAQISISAANMPVPDTLMTDSVPSLLGTVPLIGNAIDYDYREDTLVIDIGNSISPSVYVDLPDLPVLDELIEAGADKSVFTATSFGNGLSYFSFDIYDFNESGVFLLGHAFNTQAYTLAPFTGNPADSIYFTFSAYSASEPLTYQAFPYTLGSNWTDTARLVSDFILDIPAFGLPNVPGQHVFRKIRTDSILGYGTVRVYTPEGPSEPYDILVNQHYTYKTDSFYLGGAPADPALLASFGLAQGQINEQSNFIDFVAADIYPYLVRFAYQDRPAGDYSNPTEVYVQKGLAQTSATFEIENAQYTTVVYPNPSTGSQVNVQLLGADFPTLNYQVTDLLGRVLNSGKTSVSNGNGMTINFSNPLPKGTYYLSLRTDNGTVVATESIVVQ